MLTEDMLASVIYTVKDYVSKLILVGDEKQLPPIGAGRPFYDIIEYFKNEAKKQNLAVLTVERRKNDTGKERNDTKLAECFANEYKAKNIQSIINSILEDKNNEFLCYINNDSLKDFESTLFNAMTEATKILSSKDNFIVKEHRYMDNPDDINGFNLSIGQSIGGKYFNERGYFDGYGCASFADNWQILTPTKRNEIGTLWINSKIHEKYKKEGLKFVKDAYEQYKFKSKFPLPVGPEQIIYGEKVIQNKNCNIKKKASNYKERIANGEIGITCHMKGKLDKDNTLNVEFSDRLGDYYCYYPSALNSDNVDCILELAYALTIHKVQGSQFKNVVVVLKKESKMLSKELIYTALTRHQDKIWIIGDNNLEDIKKYVSDEYSELAKRFTNLFYAPKIRVYKEKYYEDRLIHIGTGNQKLRSKSEVIVWDKLKAHEELSVLYEEQFDNTTLLPDFTIVNNKTNKKYIWEHLGLVNDIDYMNHWKWKEEIYKANGFSKEIGNLIISHDENNGGIDSTKIDDLIKKVI